MSDVSKRDRAYLKEFLAIAKDPGKVASRYLRVSYALYATAALFLFGVISSQALGIGERTLGLLLVLFGITFTAASFYRISARQIPVMMKFMHLDIEAAEEALEAR